MKRMKPPLSLLFAPSILHPLPFILYPSPLRIHPSTLLSRVQFLQGVLDLLGQFAVLGGQPKSQDAVWAKARPSVAAHELGQLLWIDGRLSVEAEPHFVFLAFDRLDQQPFGGRFQQSVAEEVSNRRRNWTVAIDQFGFEVHARFGSG